MQIPGPISVAIDRLIGRFFYPFHRWMYRVSGGRVGSRYAGGRIVLLTTTGRRSGQERTHPLLSYPDGEDWIVVASNGGRPKHPAWYLNLRANPKGGLQVGPKRWPVQAEIAEGAERERLWALVTSGYRGYRYYQTLTEREIPLVRLRPSAV